MGPPASSIPAPPPIAENRDRRKYYWGFLLGAIIVGPLFWVSMYHGWKLGKEEQNWWYFGIPMTLAAIGILAALAAFASGYDFSEY
jgi:uncharacterized membrane protein YhaH (DUF805 family)